MNKNTKIPYITKDRLDSSIEMRINTVSAQDKQIQSFLKGKESTQTLTTRIPRELYSKFRKISFDKNVKMNQIIVQLIKNYVLGRRN